MKKRVFGFLMMLLVAAGLLGGTALAANVLVWPVPASRTLSQGLHDGNAIDISAATGSTVLVAKGGTVTKITYCTQTHHSYGDCNGFGTGLVILGDDGRAYQYAHMQAGSIPSNVYYGARVEAGQQIGKVGMTGYAYGPHLHFGISNTRNYWEAGSNPANETYGNPTAVTISVGNQSASNISNTNAKLFGTLYKAAGYNCSVCGIYLGTSTSNMTKRNTESVGAAANNCRGGSSFDIWYDLTGELKIVLTPGTTYYYRFYAVVNGKEYLGPVSSFRTTGNAPSAPSSSAGSSTSSGSSTTSGSAQSGAGTSSTRPGTTQVKAKRAQYFWVYPGKVTVRYSTLKRSSRWFRIYTIGAKGKVTLKSSSRYIKVSGTKVTIAKKTPRGTYTIKVTAAGNTSYKAASKTVKIVIR